MNDLTQARRLIKECQETQNPYLDLGYCGITDLTELPELFKCKHLETLILSNVWYDKKSRRWVNSRNSVKYNKLNTIPKEISNLKKIKKIIISGEHGANWTISDIRFLENLTRLQFLDIRNNQISDIRFLENLTELQSLDLSYNQISDIRFLENLTDLQSLYLGSNKITDIRFLERLTGLKSLDLASNKISDIRSLERLTGLQSLDLASNKITNICSLENLTRLQSLDLFYNQISDIRFLENLTDLQSLYLASNKIFDIHFLENLLRLQFLDLRYNQIKEIPSFIFQLEMEMSMSEYYFKSGLGIYGNPIKSPPLEVVKQGKQAVLDWFEATKEKLNEIKIILIGEPKAGKTSLLRRLTEDTFNEKEVQTDGVNIEDIAFGKCDTFKEQTLLNDITGHFWDFGGQEFMKATHQFFFTRRTIYVLVLEARKDRKIAEDIRNWVKQIVETGGNSPIIVLANQIDVNTGFGFKYERELQDEFPQIIDFIPTSCKEENNEGIRQLKDTLAELILSSFINCVIK